MQYRVFWDIDIDADSPEEAAREALKIMRDPSSIATCFQVQEQPSGFEHNVDLSPADGYDQEKAMSEGWLLAEQSEDSCVCIQRYDSAAIFDSDLEAQNFVKARAEAGDENAKAALAQCTGESFYVRGVFPK